MGRRRDERRDQASAIAGHAVNSGRAGSATTSLSGGLNPRAGSHILAGGSARSPCAGAVLICRSRAYATTLCKNGQQLARKEEEERRADKKEEERTKTNKEE